MNIIDAEMRVSVFYLKVYLVALSALIVQIWGMRDLGNHPLSELLAARIRFLDGQTSELQKQLEAITLEREFTAAALKDWKRTQGETAKTPQPRKTIKQAIVEVLNRYPDGLTRDQILTKSLEDAGLSIDPPSVGSQLQRLEESGQIVRSGKTWCLRR